MHKIQTESVTLPLIPFSKTPALRAAFYRGSKDAGNSFAVPAPKAPVLTGGQAVMA